MLLIDARERLRSSLVITLEALAVSLVDAPESAELALHAVPISVVIAIFGRQLSARELVHGLDPLYHLHRKRQGSFPARLQMSFVVEVEARGRRILDAA